MMGALSTIADEPETREETDPLAGESPTATRVISDAQQLNELAGQEVAGLLDGLTVLLNSAAADDDRLTAASKLRAIAETLQEGDEKQQAVARKLLRRVNLAEAGVAGLKESGASDEIRSLTNDLVIRSTVDFEEGNRIAHAVVARKNYELLRQKAPIVFEKISNVFARDYFNYNLHLVVSETMLSKLTSDYRTETGAIADCILGAWVTGSQVTDTTVSTDIKPSSDNASFNILVNGRTRTDTKGRKKPATIYSKGNHSFVIRKPTYFDGEQLTADEAKMNVTIRTRTTGVSTDYDRIPIFGGVARGIARRRAAQQQPQADAIAARKLAARALPEFEEEIGEQFAEANDKLENTYKVNLRNRGLEPTALTARSSETHLAISTRTNSDESLAAPRAAYVPSPKKGLSIQLHQSTVNAAIDSLGLRAQMTPSEVLDRIEESMSELLERKVELDRSNVDDGTVLDFSNWDPVRVRFDDGELVIILRTGFIQKDRDRTVEKHLLEIPIGIKVEGNQVVLTPPGTTTRDIVGLKSGPLVGRASPRTVIQARKVIQELLQKTFQEPTITRDASFSVELSEENTIDLAITAIEISDGWLTLVME